MIASATPLTHRVAVLFDLENIEIDESKSAKHYLKLDYPEVMRRIQTHSSVHRALDRRVAYQQDEKLSVDKQVYYERGAGMTQVVRTPKDADHFMHADAVIFAINHFDVIVIVGGDRDVLPFMPIFKMYTVKIEVWSWRNKISQKTIDGVDEFKALTRDLILD